MVKEEYIVTCWHCLAEFDVMEASFCNHPDSTKICPFCLNCYCDASPDYKLKIEKLSSENLKIQKETFKKKQDMKLGEILVSAGKISEEKLAELIRIQQKTKKKLGALLIQMNILSREELTVFLMEQKSVESTNLERESIDFQAVFVLGREKCIKKRIIPFELSNINTQKLLRLGIDSKENLLKLKLDQDLADYILIPYLLSDQDIQTGIQRIKDYGTDLMILD